MVFKSHLFIATSITYPLSFSLFSPKEFLSNTLILPSFSNGITFSHTYHSPFLQRLTFPLILVFPHLLLSYNPSFSPYFYHLSHPFHPTNRFLIHSLFLFLLPTLFYLLINNTCISLFPQKNFYQIHSSLLTISLPPSTNCPSHPILPFSSLSFHPSFIFYSLVFLLSLL